MADEGLGRLARELRAAASIADEKAKAIVKRGAQNIKDDWQRRMRAGSRGHIPHLPRSISYDIAEVGGEIRAEIGPDYESPQGPLAHLIEFGSVNNPPHNDGGQALRAEAPKFYREISKAEGGFA